ncbi:Growth hormone secretagogue receptor type 1 [Exaiptasia diaphana]|nr:Growth hormone secretagogue receptor type 1 [Exaiptasia diaphana]
MAVSDLLFTMIAVPRTIGELLSKISKTWYLTGLLAIAVDRYYAVVYPMRTGVITSTFRKILVTCIWLIAMVFHVPYFLAFRLQTDPVSKVTICIYHWKYNVSSGKAYFALSSGFLFILPLLVMSAIYTIILISIRSRKIPGNANSSSLRRHKIKRNRKVLTMVLAVLFAFLVCWLPMNIYGYLLFFQWYMPTPCTQPLEKLVILCIAYSNAAVNPFIYFALSENYRHAALHLMRFRKRRPSRHLENTITTRNSSFATQLMPKNSKRALKDNTELTELSKRYKNRPDSARCCLVEKSLNSTSN